MRLRCFWVVLGLLALSVVAAVPAQAASSQPPTPPPPPNCPWCSGPPPPPTLVPTAPPDVTRAKVVAVELSPVHVRRGHAVKLKITATPGDTFKVEVRYHKTKPVHYHGRVKDNGTGGKTWHVPKNAALGKAMVQVTISGGADAYIATGNFVVTK